LSQEKLKKKTEFVIAQRIFLSLVCGVLEVSFVLKRIWQNVCFKSLMFSARVTIEKSNANLAFQQIVHLKKMEFFTFCETFRRISPNFEQAAEISIIAFFRLASVNVASRYKLMT
jgi:hypothetical protein